MKALAPLAIREELVGTPYDHVRALALGGMGEVHVVLHRALREERVLKLVRTLGADTAEELARRMKVEGRILRALRHPNIVEFLDLGVTPSGKPYLVTELLHGCTLNEELSIRGQALPAEEVLEILDQMLSATAVAHDAGVVHRDIKPLNGFYEGPVGEPRNRRIKLLDFGIAKVISRAAKLRAGSALVMTREGLAMGSASYMPPEQVLGQAIDHRADLYAIGCVGFFLLTGKPPYRGLSAVDIMQQQILSDPRSPRAIDPSLPAGLCDVIVQSMAKDPGARFQTAEVMRRALLSTRSREASKPVQRTVRLEPDAAHPSPWPASSVAGSIEDTVRQPTPVLSHADPRGPVRAPQPSGADTDTIFPDRGSEPLEATQQAPFTGPWLALADGASPVPPTRRALPAPADRPPGPVLVAVTGGLLVLVLALALFLLLGGRQ